MKQYEARRYARAAVAASTVPAAPAKPTDLSKRLRQSACFSTPSFNKMLTDAADEIERYYGGMLNWKRTAEAKDAGQAPAQPALQADAGADAGKWIPWPGGHWDGDPDLVVEVKPRADMQGRTAPASKFICWKHRGTLDDIIAYRVVGAALTSADEVKP